MTKIWSVVAPMLFCIWILYYELEIILPKVGIELNSSSLLNVILKIASFVLVITSGFIGGKIWSKIAGHYLKEDELKKFIMQ
ncbi:MAG: hypothetical protein NTX22_16270 [Ignavibacteriales bacterium]|nr:hypothetical protein [Ignavibacteriales bacterium]